VCKLINNVTENQRGNQDWTIQQHWQHWVHKTQEDKQNKKHNTICVGHHYTQDTKTRI
jgi:hypothetical protein